MTIAAAVGGIGARGAQALVLPVSGPNSGVTGEVVLVTATAVACYLVIVDKSNAEGVGWPRRIPAFVLAVVSLIGAASVWLLLAFDLLARTTGIDPATVAALRTATLSLSAIILAVLGSRRFLVELTSLVYPLLVITGAKLLVEDLRQGRPLTLFISFAFFGIALILAPRLVRRPGPPATAGQSDR